MEKEGIAIPDKLKQKPPGYLAQAKAVEAIEAFVEQGEVAVSNTIKSNLPDDPDQAALISAVPESETAETPVTVEVPETAEVTARSQQEKSDQEDVIKPELKPKINFEQQFGARLPVWVGGIALALAGFFLVKYSIENNLISPLARVVLGGLFGGVLLYGGDWIRKKPNFANGVRIAQSLSGAGIAVLYVVVYATSGLYQLVPGFLGFLGMALVTFSAVILSLLHGLPIALLGLLGGYLTPSLVESEDPSAPILFIYLYLIFSGLMVVIRRRAWWVLSIPAVIGAYLWVIFWTIGNEKTSDSLWLGLFLAAVSLTIVISSRSTHEEGFDEKRNFNDWIKPASIFNYLGLGGSILLMAGITVNAGFGFLEWSLFGFLGLGAIFLAFINDRLYGFVPLLSMVVNVAMLGFWETPDINAYAVTLVIFAFIYIGTGYFLMRYAGLPYLWAILIGSSSLAYYLLAYFKLSGLGLVEGIPYFWGFAALVIAAAAVYVLREVRHRYQDHPHNEYLLAIFAITATAFISIGLSIELEHRFLSIAIALEMLAISWINCRIPIKALRYICMALAVVFGIILIPQVLLMVQLTTYSLVEAKLNLQDSIPIVNWPTLQLGLPALAFIGTAYLLRRNEDWKVVRALEFASVGLIAVMGYYLARHAFHADSDVLFVKAGFFERGVITNVLFVYGLACFFIGRRFNRMAFSWSGFGLCSVALFRIIYFDLILYNPLFADQIIGGWFVLNSLLLPYGLPILWTGFAGKEASFLLKPQLAIYLKGFRLLLLFTLVSFNVRYFFHDDYLNSFITTSAEKYSYSVVWLALGLALLLAGVIKHDKMLRFVSLGIMILTVGKVFVYDASVLEGLYRVFSFFGLGLSLLGLSWFYTRFVFVERNPEDNIANNKQNPETPI